MLPKHDGRAQPNEYEWDKEKIWIGDIIDGGTLEAQNTEDKLIDRESC
jgi:hypothetical protein